MRRIIKDVENRKAYFPDFHPANPMEYNAAHYQQSDKNLSSYNLHLVTANYHSTPNKPILDCPTCPKQ
ncbi:MAG: hypothetical protein ACI977_000454 [Candidatus Nanohaloarchaea archaeon]|jgi:hypothetical protein